MKLETAQDLISVCNARRITLYRADGNRIGFRARKAEAVTEALKNAMRLFKEEILAWIDEHAKLNPIPNVPRSHQPATKIPKIPHEFVDAIVDAIALGKTGWVKSVRTNRWYEIHPTAIKMASTLEGGRIPDDLEDFCKAINGDGWIADQPTNRRF